jgi:hypothetical protein
VSIVMGLDQHRAQISAEWIETVTGEVSRARIRPADRAGVRAFLAPFAGDGLEVALEATTGWRFVVEELEAVGADVHLAEPAEAAALKGNKKRAKTDWADARHLRELLLIGRVPESWNPARASAGSSGAGPDAALVVASADRMAAADPLRALSPRYPPAAQPADRGAPSMARRAAVV